MKVLHDTRDKVGQDTERRHPPSAYVGTASQSDALLPDSPTDTQEGFPPQIQGTKREFASLNREPNAKNDLSRRGVWPAPKRDRLEYLWTVLRLSQSECAARLDVSLHSVAGKLYRMGLHNGTRKVPLGFLRTKITWTDALDARLRQLRYADAMIAEACREIGELAGRPVGARTVHARTAELGLPRFRKAEKRSTRPKRAPVGAVSGAPSPVSLTTAPAAEAAMTTQPAPPAVVPIFPGSTPKTCEYLVGNPKATARDWTRCGAPVAPQPRVPPRFRRPYCACHLELTQKPRDVG